MLFRSAYGRGGPAELVIEGVNGCLARPDDLDALAQAVCAAAALDRAACRAQAELHHSQSAFTARIEAWLQAAQQAAHRNGPAAL